MAERANRREVSDSVLAAVKRWLGAYAWIYQLPYHAGQIRVQLTNFIGVQSWKAWRTYKLKVSSAKYCLTLIKTKFFSICTQDSLLYVPSKLNVHYSCCMCDVVLQFSFYDCLVIIRHCMCCLFSFSFPYIVGQCEKRLFWF